jgi:hypothetical protein
MQPRPTGVVPGNIWLEVGRVHQVRTEGAANADSGFRPWVVEITADRTAGAGRRNGIISRDCFHIQAPRCASFCSRSKAHGILASEKTDHMENGFLRPQAAVGGGSVGLLAVALAADHI